MNVLAGFFGTQDAWASAGRPGQAADAKPAAASAPPASASKGEGPLREVARSFEAVFTQMLMQSMRSTVRKSEMFSGGRGEEVFTGLLDMNVAQSASKAGRGLGIAEMIVKQYARNVRSEKSGASRFDVRVGEKP